MGALSAIFRTDGAPASAATLRRMQEAVAHRGGEGREVLAGPVALGHRRWASSLPEGQPARDDGAGLSLVLAGRLYNGRELTAALAAAGQAPADGSHTGAILAAYRAWGPACAERLDGEFAFVLHDATRGRLLAARDAVGVKPLYYASRSGVVLLASEPKQLLAAGVSCDPCEETVSAYLSFVSHLSGGPQTFFRDILQLEPGHWLLVDGGEVRTRKYWDLQPAATIAERSPEAMVERVRWLVEDAVARRVPEVPPFGCELSGGFDSSSVASLCRRVLDARGMADGQETFSFEFHDDTADEPEMIDVVARAVRARHHHVFLDRENVFDALPDIIAAVDGPAFDLGLLVLWRTKQQAASVGVATLLSGLGGDEIFLGRLHFFADLLRAGRLPTLAREIRGFYPIDVSTGKRTSLRALLANSTILPLFPRELKKFWRERLLRENPIGPWIRPDFALRTRLAERIRRSLPGVYPDHYRQNCYETLHYEIRSITLPIHEALGGRLGVDTRFPLLDRRLVEYMFAVPREQKIREGRGRILQKEVMRGIVPAPILEEHLKKDFHPVLARQQRGHFERELERLLARPRLLSEDFVDWRRIRSLHRDMLGRGAKAWYPLFYALNLEWWLERVVRPERGAAASV